MRWEDFTFEGSPIRRRIGFDEVEQKIVVDSIQDDINDVLAMNRSLANADRASTSLWRPGGFETNYVLVGKIPVWCVEKLWQEGVRFNDPDGMARIVSMMNSNEYSDWKVAPGRL